MPRLYVQVEHLANTVAGFDWTQRLASSLWQLGIEAVVRVASQPAGLESHPLSPGELQDLMFVADPGVRDEAFADGSWYVYLLVAGANPTLLGAMFDTGFDARDREGCALFAQRISAVAGGDSMLFDRLLSRSALHEIGHCLNLVHPTSTADLAVMASTARLQVAAGWPENVGFDYSAGDRSFCAQNPDQCEPGNGVPFRGASGEDRGTSGRALRLELDALQGVESGGAMVGCPVTLLLTLENRGKRPRPIWSAPRFSDGSLRLLITSPGGGPPRRYDFPFYGCPASRPLRVLRPAERWTTSTTIYYQRTGFAFPRPGRYCLRALVRPVQTGRRWLMSNVLELDVGGPEGAGEDLAMQLDPEVGEYLELGGASRLEAGHQKAMRLAGSSVDGVLSTRLTRSIEHVVRFRAARSDWERARWRDDGDFEVMRVPAGTSVATAAVETTAPPPAYREDLWR